MNWKLVENHQIYLHTENWVDRVQDGRLAAIFVCRKWRYLPIFKFPRFLFIIYIHNELKTCGKSSNLSAHRKLGWSGSRWPTGGYLCLWKMTLFANFPSFICFHRSFLFIICIHHELKTCGKSSNLSAHKNWVDRVQNGRLAAIFVCEKWHYLPIFQVFIVLCS